MADTHRSATPKVVTQRIGGLHFLLFFAICVAVNVTGIALYDSTRSTRIMTVDVDAVMNHQLETFRHQFTDPTPEKQLLTNSKRWALGLEKILKDIADREHAVIFTRPAIVEGSTDITTIVIDRLQAMGVVNHVQPPQ